MIIGKNLLNGNIPAYAVVVYSPLPHQEECWHLSHIPFLILANQSNISIFWNCFAPFIEAFQGGWGYAVALLVISETACRQVGLEKMSLSHFSFELEK